MHVQVVFPLQCHAQDCVSTEEEERRMLSIQTDTVPSKMTIPLSHWDQHSFPAVVKHIFPGSFPQLQKVE